LRRTQSGFCPFSAYLFQNDDRRVIFVNPHEGDLTLVGTTDNPYEGRAEGVAIDGTEVQYLLRALGRFLRIPPPTTLFMPSPARGLSMTIAPRIRRR
jgi:glycerol-3-phosphate dehydrogenase